MLLGLVLLVSGCSDPTGPEEARLTAAREGVVKSMAFDVALSDPTALSLDPIRDAIDDAVTSVTSHVALMAP